MIYNTQKCHVYAPRWAHVTQTHINLTDFWLGARVVEWGRQGTEMPHDLLVLNLFI